MRKAAYAVAAVAAVFVLVAAVLPRVVSLDAFRPRLLAAIEERTGRKAGLAGISLSLFPGVGLRVRELTLSGDPGREDEKLLEVPEAEIRLALLPLLSGRARFTGIVLDRPSILYRRNADGTDSFTDISRRLSARTAPSAPPAPPAGAELSIDSLAVRDARLRVRLPDDAGGEKAWDLDAVNARLAKAGEGGYRFDVSTNVGGSVGGHVALTGTLERERGADGAFLLSGEGDLLRQELRVEGRIVRSGVTHDVDLSVTMPKVRLADLAAALRKPPAALAAARPEGHASVTAKLSGTPDALGFEVDADLQKAGWTVAEGFRKFIDMPCTLVVQGHRFPDQLILSNAELRFPPLLVIANLSATPSTGALEWSASSRITSLSEFARSRGELLQRWSPAGRLTASGRGGRAGKNAPSTWTASVDLGEVGFQLPESRMDFRSLEGHLSLAPGVVEFAPLAGLLNGQRFLLRGKLAQGDRAAGPLELRMAYFDLDALFPGDDHGRKGRKEKPERSAADGGKAAPKVAFAADLSIDAGRAKGIDFRDLSGRVRFERGIHTFEDLRAKVYGGEATVTGRLASSGSAPDFRIRGALRGVEASELLVRKTSLGNLVSGPVSADFEIGGDVTDFARFSRSARGEGALSLSGGRIRGVDLAGEAARLAGLSLAVPPAKVRETPFSSLSARFRIEGGKIRTDSIRIDSDRFGLDGTAAVGFDRTLDFVGTLRLPPSVTAKAAGGVGKYLVGPSGRIEIPLVMSGPVSAPAMAVNTKALAKGAAERAVRDLVGKPPAADNGTSGRGEPAEAAGRAIRGVIERFLPAGKGGGR